MMLAGDELLRTQRGNNNAWCQDNAVSWLDWSLQSANADFFRFCREVIALRKRHPAFRRRTFLSPGDVTWHGTEVNRPDFSSTSRALAMALDGRRTGREPDRDFYLAFSAAAGPLSFAIPAAPQGRPWRRLIDTALASPLDVVGPGEGPIIHAGSRYNMAPFSMIVLMSEG
jgi:glycogen operon protein